MRCNRFANHWFVDRAIFILNIEQDHNEPHSIIVKYPMQQEAAIKTFLSSAMSPDMNQLGHFVALYRSCNYSNRHNL